MSDPIDLTQAIDHLIAAQVCIEVDDKVGKGENLNTAYGIVSELHKSLPESLSKDLVAQISKTYEFICRQIILGNVFNSVGHVNNALLILRAMRNTEIKNNKDQQ